MASCGVVRPSGSFCFRSRRLGAQPAGRRNQDRQQEGARSRKPAGKQEPGICFHLPSFSWNIAKWLRRPAKFRWSREPAATGGRWNLIELPEELVNLPLAEQAPAVAGLMRE